MYYMPNKILRLTRQKDNNKSLREALKDMSNARVG